MHAESSAGRLVGVIVQLGGQTPLRLAQALKDEGVPIIGTSPESIHLAEERGAFGQVLARAGLPAPRHGTARSFEEAQAIAATVGYPCSCAGTCSAAAAWRSCTTTRCWPTTSSGRPMSTPSIRCSSTAFDDAVEIDVDALYVGRAVLAGHEHQGGGIHSGLCVRPAPHAGCQDIDRIRASTLPSPRVGVLGLLNVQYALAGTSSTCSGQSAPRTVPFVSRPRRYLSRRPRRGDGRIDPR